MQRGISMMMLVVAISVMMILVTSASVIGMNSIHTANFEKYQSILSRISDDVNYYYIENDELPVKKNEYGVEIIDPKSVDMEFLNQVAENGDSQNELFVLDLTKLEDNTITFVDENEIYLVANHTHHIYALNGFQYKSKIYYCI